MTTLATWPSALRTAAVRTALLAVPLGLVLIYALTQGASGARLGTVALINVMVVVGIQTFTGNTGIVSFGHVGFVALGAYVTALLTASPRAKSIRVPEAPFGLAEVELSPFVGVLVAVLIVLLLALFIGLAISRLGGISASMITLGLLIIVYNVLTDLVFVSGGAEGFFGVPTAASAPVVFVATLVAVGVAALFRESPVGLHAQAVREDELAARAMGVNPSSSRLVSWLISAGVCAAGGALFALFLGAITPRDFYLNLTFTTLAMLFVGGVGSVTGAVVGVLVITVGNELFRWLGDGPSIAGTALPQIPGLTDIFLGLAIAGTMLWRTQGLCADVEVDQWLARRLPARRLAAPPSPAPTQPTHPAVEPRTDRTAHTSDLPLTLRGEGLRCVFGGLTAVNDVDLEVGIGEVVGLIGPNGSGKSTMLNLLSAVIPPTGGRVTVGGEAAPARSDRMAAAGVGRSFQNVRLFHGLTAAQNIAVSWTSVGRRRAAVAAADDLLPLVVRSLDLGEVLGRKADTLPYGVQRKLEIARAVALRPDFVLLDEPVAGMNEVESEEIADVVRLVAREFGCGVLVVDHDLPFILGLCDRIYVMDSGRCLATGSPEEIRTNPDVIAAYLGVS